VYVSINIHVEPSLSRFGPCLRSDLLDLLAEYLKIILSQCMDFRTGKIWLNLRVLKTV